MQRRNQLVFLSLYLFLLLFLLLFTIIPCDALPIIHNSIPISVPSRDYTATSAVDAAAAYEVIFARQYQALHPERLNTNDKHLATGPYLLGTSVDHSTLTKGILLFHHPYSQTFTPSINNGGLIQSQQPVIIPNLQLHQQTFSSSSSSIKSTTRPLTTQDIQYSTTIERYFSLYIPTFKCDGSSLFCRAFLTTYYNKATGATNVIAGYTIFSVNENDANVPSHVLKRVDETRDGEMFHYSMELGSTMIDEKAYRCRLYMFRVAHALRKAIEKMRECNKLERYSCTKFSFVDTC